MRLSPSAAGLLAFAASASAFADSSPFVLFSTAEFEKPAEAAQLQTGDQLLQSVQKIIGSCPTERYQIITQPGANAADIRGTDGCRVPSLCGAITDDRVKGSFSVAEVVGAAEEFDAAALTEYIQSSCESKGKTPQIWQTALPALPSKNRDNQLAENDKVLGETLESIQSSGSDSDSYTVLFLTSPGEAVTYEADFGDTLSKELRKLRARSAPTRRDDNSTEWNKLPLFEKYQFFTLGLFHGIIATILLLSIMTVGLKAIGSLQVSYAAFDKDAGPAAQKKQN